MAETFFEVLFSFSASGPFRDTCTFIIPIFIAFEVNTSQLLLPQHQSTYPRGPESALIEIPLSDPNLLSKNTSKCKHCETRFTSYKTVFENFMK